MKLREHLKRDKAFYLASLSVMLFLVFVSYRYVLRAVDFRFVDEFNNWVAGYLMLEGRVLFKQIFFNHQLLGADLSYGLQKVFQPDSLYELVVLHRIAVIGFALGFNFFLMLRFRWIGLGFALFYEVIKYYLFGHLFLAESFVVYFCVYLMLLVLHKINDKPVYFHDYLLSALSVWFVLFAREPYSLVILFLYGCLLYRRSEFKSKISSVVLLLILSVITLTTVSLPDYLFQVFAINLQAIPFSQMEHTNRVVQVLVMTFYPFYILVQGKWNELRILSIGLALIWISLTVYRLVVFKRYKEVILIYLSLGLANLRYGLPGDILYGAFHMIVWYGLFVSTMTFLSWEMFKDGLNGRKAQPVLGGLAICFGYMVIAWRPLLWEKVERADLYKSNYETFYTYGEVINRLSTGQSTMFVDYWDTLVYWQAKRQVAYTYSLFLPGIGSGSFFSLARNKMFEEDPPDFYFTDCDITDSKAALGGYSEKYTAIRAYGKSSCLAVLNSTIDTISTEQWQSVKEMGFER